MDKEVLFRVITSVPGFLLAIVCHEWAHARMALGFGDNTAKAQGRLTLHPLAHLDMVGTVIFPLICVMFGGMIFGYAKPVPISPSRFKKIRSGIFWVSFAGPGMNIILGIVSAFLLAVTIAYVPRTSEYFPFVEAILSNSLMINLILAAFNLIPFPPLDGSKMVTSFLNYENARKFESLERFSLVFLLLLWFTNISQFIFYPAMKFADILATVFLNLVA